MKKYKCNRCLKTAHNRENLKCFRCDRQIAESHGMDTQGITFTTPSITFESNMTGNSLNDTNDYSGGGGESGGGGASSDF